MSWILECVDWEKGNTRAKGPNQGIKTKRLDVGGEEEKEEEEGGGEGGEWVREKE